MKCKNRVYPSHPSLLTFGIVERTCASELCTRSIHQIIYRLLWEERIVCAMRTMDLFEDGEREWSEQSRPRREPAIYRAIPEVCGLCFVSSRGERMAYNCSHNALTICNGVYCVPYTPAYSKLNSGIDAHKESWGIRDFKEGVRLHITENTSSGGTYLRLLIIPCEGGRPSFSQQVLYIGYELKALVWSGCTTGAIDSYKPLFRYGFVQHVSYS